MTEPFSDLLPPPLPKRFSVSFIGSAGECMLKAKAERTMDTSNVFTTIGRAAHEVFATCELMAQFSGRMKLYPEEAQAVAQQVLGNPEEVQGLALVVYRVVMNQAAKFAESVDFPIDADTWVIEHPFRLPLVDPQDGTVYIISGRMDEYAIWGTHYRNRDWKTGPKLPSRREVQDEHTQLPIYAWAAKQEMPWLETFEPIEFYTRYGQPRSIEMTADDVDKLEGFLLASCRRMRRAYLTGEFPTSPGSWCNNRCPVARECPEPDSVKGGGYLQSDEEAAAQIRAAIVEQASAAARMQAVKAYLETHPEGNLVVDKKRYGFVPVEKADGSTEAQFATRKA